MRELIRIESISDPRVGDYANLQDLELWQRDEPAGDRHDTARHGGGLFMAEGELVVRRLIESTMEVRSVFLTPTRLTTISDAIERLPAEVPVYVAEQAVLSEVVGFNIHRGVLAAGVRPHPRPLDELLTRPGPFLILEDLFNHDNIGSIFRNAAALGGGGATVLLTRKSADPLYRKCIRVSVGNVLSVPFARLPDFPNAAGADGAAFGRAGIELWAMTPGEGREGVLDIGTAAQVLRSSANGAVRPRIALMLGSEGPGLSDAALALADRRVRIPMRPAHAHVDSLNVAVAAAVGLYALTAADA